MVRQAEQALCEELCNYLKACNNSIWIVYGSTLIEYDSNHWHSYWAKTVQLLYTR